MMQVWSGWFRRTGAADWPRVLPGLLMLVLLILPARAAPFEDSMAQRMLACTGCHGENGRAAGDVYFPRLAGKPAGYLFNQLRNFRSGRRAYPLMTGMLDLLDDAYLREIAEHFAGLEFPYPAPQGSNALPQQQQLSARALVFEGDGSRQLPPCASCHGKALTGVQPHVPGLLGLPRDYINSQLGAWKTGQRQTAAPDCMAHVARALAVDEVAALSAWLALQPVPADSRAVKDLAASERAGVPACGSAPGLGARKP